MTAREAQAAVLIAPKRPLELRMLVLPAPGYGQVRVRVAYSGVCRSQLLEIRGERGPDLFLPHTLGHEGSGEVLEIGPGVQKVRPGDRVVLSWIRGSGADAPSAGYDSATGRVNSGAISTFMRETITCENRLTVIPASMPLREAALLGCAVPTGAGIVLNTLRVEAGSSVAVFGVGGIGLAAVVAARLMNATTIIAVDIAPKLARARSLGATHTVDAGREDAAAAVKQITEGGADYAIEAAGRGEAMEAAFRSVRDQGGVCVLAGNVPYGGRITIDPFDLIKGKRLVGTWGGETVPDRDIGRYVRLYESGRLDLSAFFTHEYTLEQINAAVDDLEAGHVGRAVINMNSGAA
jgi:S-(hydroxymethyl)glutathione dehydrogenase/alcohol dehydrogenase